MNPNNQTPPSDQQPAPNPYDFMYASPTKQKPGIPGGMKGRIIVVAIGLVILTILALVVVSFLGSSGRARTQKYTEIAQRQTEIIRLASIGELKSKSLETKSFATTTKLTFSSSQSDMTALLEKNGVSTKELSKQLTASKNTKSDQVLNEAEKNNRFDETLTELLTKEITNYKIQLSAAASGATKSDTSTLEKAFNQADTLIPETKK